MKRFLLALALAAPLAACGPDCDKFCRRWVQDCQLGNDLAQCTTACNEVGSDNAAFISCVNDRTCDDIRSGGHCQIPKSVSGLVP